MKKTIRILTAFVFLLYPVVCFPSFLIELKNDASFIASQHWREEDQIKFYYYGGLVGIEEKVVRDIRDSDLEYIEVEDLESDKDETTQAFSIGEKGPDTETASTTAQDSIKEALLDEKRGIIEGIQDASDAYREAKAKKNTKQISEQRQKLLSLQTHLTELREKVRTTYGGQMPVWWAASD